MVALGFAFIAVMAYFFYRASFRQMQLPALVALCRRCHHPRALDRGRARLVRAEFGRQPWTVDGVLPTALSASHLSVADLLITLAGFVTFYSVLFVIEMSLMVKYIRKGPFLDVAETEAWQARHEAPAAHP
jgi:cytochrome d ubiquinol oxidase subunit I